MSVPLSILDLSPISAGSNAQQALRNTIDLAQQAQAWGYKRFWVAEHHFVATASSSPAVLIGLIAAATTSIRVGSAAVLVGHQSSAAIVEAFGTIDAIHPGRIDLGIGRSGHRKALIADAVHAPAIEPGPDRVIDGVVIPAQFLPGTRIDPRRVTATIDALQLPGATPLPFAEHVAQIRALLDGTYQVDGVDLHASPGEGAALQLWLVGSSGGESARLAGALGLPFTASYHVTPATVLETVAAYRESFRPSASLERPYVVVSADVVVAHSDERARELAATYGHWVYDIRVGTGAQPVLDPAHAAPLSAAQRALVADRLSTQFVGAPDTVAERLDALQKLTGADELLVTSVTYRHADRLESHRLLAQEWNSRFRLAA